MAHKKLLIVFIVLSSFLLSSCAYNSASRYISFPPKGCNCIIGCSLYDTIGCIPINPNDIILVKEYAITDIFTIIGIKSRKGVYRIEVQKDSLYHYRHQNFDSSFRDIYYYPTYEIFTVKTEKLKGYTKIKKGRKYKLTLNPYFRHNILSDFNTRGVYIKGRHFGISTGLPNIYTTPNIDGLYYMSAGVSL